MATSSDACPSTPSSASTGTETELARLEAPQYSYGTANTNASVTSTVVRSGYWSGRKYFKV